MNRKQPQKNKLKNRPSPPPAPPKKESGFIHGTISSVNMNGEEYDYTPRIIICSKCCIVSPILYKKFRCMGCGINLKRSIRKVLNDIKN